MPVRWNDLLCPKVCSFDKGNNRITFLLGKSYLAAIVAKNHISLMLKKPCIGIGVVFLNIINGFGFRNRESPATNNPDAKLISLRQDVIDISLKLELLHCIPRKVMWGRHNVM